MSFNRIQLGLVAVSVGCVSILAIAGCDSLEIPNQSVTNTNVSSQDAGDTGTTPPSNIPPGEKSLVPPGAIPGEAKVPKWGGGTTYTWVTLDAGGKVKEISWSLPIQSVVAVQNSQAELFEYLELPAIAHEQTFVKALGMDFRPTGHTPVGVYDLAHFEFHITSIATPAFDAIDCNSDVKIPGDMRPTNVKIDAPFGCLPRMGTHGYNQLEPEYNQEKFSVSSHLTYYPDPPTATNATITSYEVKATVETLLKRTTFEFKNFSTIRPPKYGRATLWPNKLVATFNLEADAYIYTLSDFTPIQ